MNKIYKVVTGNYRHFAKRILLSILVLTAVTATVSAQQVTVTATVGNPLRTYTTLKEAFDAINDGTHQGVIVVSVNANTNEGTTPAVLNSGDADPANYTLVTVRPSADGVTVTGNPGAGFGVVEFNGADNVIFDGDNPNTGGTNRNLTITNAAPTAQLGNSCVRIATSALVNSANNITIKNLVLNGNVTSGNAVGIANTNTSSNISFGIYCGGNGGATALIAPTAITNETSQPAPLGSTINNLSIDNNLISQCGRGIVFNGGAASVSTGVTINGNLIGSATALGSYPYSSPATTVYAKGIWAAGTEALTISNNTVRNILSYLNTSLGGIEISGSIGTGVMNVSGNTVTGVANNNATVGSAIGILVGASGAAFTVASNTISVIENKGDFASIAGLQINTNVGVGTLSENNISKLFAHSLNGAGAFGIELNSAASGTTIQNNVIYDLMNVGKFFVSFNVNGILLNSGGNHKVYHNSVSLYGAATTLNSSAYNCLYIGSSSYSGIDIRNNIFSNKITGGSFNDVFTCVFLPYASVASMNLTLNNNAYYTGSVAGKSGIAFAGQNSYNVDSLFLAANFVASTNTPNTNWRSYSGDLGVSSNDNASFASSAAAPFVSATDLHIPSNATTTPLESGGAVVGVATDIDGQVRPGPAGSVNGGATLPDIGADEFDRALDDKYPPLISSFLPTTCGTGFRTVTATITDASGVPTAGAGLPRLFWRINGGAWQAPVTANYLSPTQYSFTFDNVSVLGDLVEYYIVAQDLASTPNVVSSPAGGTGYTPNPPTAGTPPPTYFSYVVIANLAAGTYDVGVGGAYTTLTAAVNAYNTSCLSGAVIFELKDATYPSETFPISINVNAAASSVNTLTIRPKAGVNATISGNNATALIKINGADYITIDGSNNGTNSVNLTLTNSNAANSAATIWIGNATTTDGATNNTVKNSNINGSGSNTSVYGVFAGSGTTLGSAAGAANSNNAITNNTIKAVQNGILINGKTSGFDQNWLINNNTIGSAAVANDKMGFRGISVDGVQNFVISGNTISGVARPSTATGTANTASGISIFTNGSNGNIFNNKISDIKHILSTGGWGSNGIFLGSNNTASNINVYNNFIWDVAGYGSSGVLQSDNGYGIMVNSGGGYKILYNSVRMGPTNQTSASSNSAAINISSGVTTVNSLDIRNNIFYNAQTTGTIYSIYSGAAASVYSAIDNNDYFTGGANLGFLVAARTTLSAWQGATGKDLNSISVNPLFVSASDLHLQTTSPLNARAVNIASYTTDIDGNARNGSTPDIGADEITPAANCGALTAGTVSALTTDICVSGSTYLKSTGFTTGTEGLSYLWEVSNDNFGVNIVPMGTNPYSQYTGTINATRYYRLKVFCSFGGSVTSPVITVNVNNPSISAYSGSGYPAATRCGPGTLTLEADEAGGNDVNWYAAPTGGAPLATASPFTTPVLTATTTYYVSGNLGGTSEEGGKIVPSTTGTFISSDYGIVFTANQALTLNSTVIYPNGTGTVTISLENSAGTEIAVTPAVAVTGTGISTPVTVPLGFAVPIGVGYRLILKSYTGLSSLVRDNPSGTPYPITSPSTAFSVTSGWLGGSVNANTYYFFFKISLNTGCESPRIPVTATITTPPAINAAVATPATICKGQSSTLTISSPSDPNYTYTWTPGSFTGPSYTVTPLVTTTYSLSALYTGPGANNGCTNTRSITVNVNPVPAPVTVTPASGTLCAGADTTLTATGGLVSSFGIVGTGTDLNSATATLGPPSMPPYGNWYTGNRHQILYTKAELLAAGFSAGTNIKSLGWYVESNTNSLGYQNFTIKVGHTSATVLTTTFLTDPTTQVFTAANYNPPVGGWTTHTFSSAFVWDGTSNLLVESYFTNCGITGSSSCSGTTCSGIGFDVTYTRNAVVRNSTTPAAYHAFYFSDGNSCDIQNRATASYAVTNRPNIRFEIENPVVFTWTETPNNASLNTTTGSVVIATPPVTTSYVAIATNSLGCTATDTTIITVNSAAASVSITANPGNVICAGTSVTFTAVPVNGGAATYQWKLNGGNVGAGGTTYTNAALNNGDIVTVVMTPNQSCVPVTPVTSNAITMTVNPSLPASVSIAANPGNVICAGTSVTFTATPTNGGAGPTYQWYIGAAAQPGEVNPTFTTSALTNGQVVSVQMVSNAPCVTGSPATSNTITMTVNPNLTASVNIVASPAGSVCTGTSVTFTATPTNGGAPPAYQWYIGATLQVGETNPTFTTTTLANGDIVTVKMTSSLPCTTPSPVTSNAITMTVTGSLPASVTIASSGSLCPGSPVTFTATPTNGGAPSYQWKVNGGNVGPNSNVYTYTPANGDVVEVVMNTSLSCAAPPSVTSNQITITLLPKPTISISYDCNTILDYGQQATITATATGTGLSYQWIKVPNTNVGTNSNTYTTNVAGNYYVVVTNGSGCSDSTSAAPVTITVGGGALAAGTYNIPGTGCAGFDKISSAVSYINAHGISGAGGVIFNIASTHTETAPAGGFAITATGTAGNPITFQRAGAGAKPVITAGVQVAGSNTDAIFKLIGSSYITIKNLRLRENPANTVKAVGGTNTMTEWGIALLNLNAGLGSNNNTIEGDSIALDRLYPNSFGIYANARHDAATPGAGSDLTAAGSGFNKVYNNLITNVNTPIVFIGAPSNMASSNDIGGTLAGTGNTITNWGSNTVPSINSIYFYQTTAPLAAVTMAGVYTANQKDLNISWNSLTSATGINVGGSNFRGIFNDYIGTAPAGTFTNNITNNTVNLNSAATSGLVEVICQYNTVNGTTAGYTLNMNNNTVSCVLTGASSGAAIVGVRNYYVSGVLSMSNNVSKGNTSTATSGGFIGLYNSAAVTASIDINNNQLGDATTDAITFSATTSGAVTGITTLAGGAASVLTINSNNITKLNGGTGLITLINIAGNSPTRNITGNTLTTSSGSGSITGMNVGGLSTTSSTTSNNTINGLSSSGPLGPNVVGISVVTGGTTTNNTIFDLTASGASANITGIQSFANNLTTSQNTIHGLIGTGGTTANVQGISATLVLGNNVKMFGNKIYDLEEANAVGSAATLVNGILISASTVNTVLTVYNNFISDLRAPSANMAAVDAIRGINLLSNPATSFFNVYYNTIYLNAVAGGTDFSTAGIFHTGSATATTARLDLRNNIIVNESVSNGTGKTVAFRRGISNANLVNYLSTSNNNDFYAGTAGANNLIFFDGTNSDQTIAQFQARVNTPARDVASISIKPVFENIATAPYDLHLKTTTNCSFDGLAQPIAGITDDIDGQVRNVTTPDIGADEFAGTGGGIGVWKGVNSNWLDTDNWCGALPTSSTNVTIPNGAAFYPDITTTGPVAKNITIQANASVTVRGAGKLDIYGAISNTGIFSVGSGTIEMLGTAGQEIPDNVFRGDSIKNLIISSDSVALKGNLDLYGKLSFTGNNRKFGTYDNLTIKSTATGTGSVGDITSNNVANNNNKIFGNVVVERFIRAKAAWRFLSVPTQNNLQTIHQAWQENQAANSPTPAGFGTQITSNRTTWAADGFDLFSQGGPSLKNYKDSTNAWIGAASTNVPFVTGKGYMTFIRGDRTINTFGPPANTTVLRDKGALVTGNYTSAPVAAGYFGAIGNPYASAIDFSKLGAANRPNLQNVYYMWDPQLGQYGGYVTFNGPTYLPTPSGGSYNANQMIESGQAFFVHSNQASGGPTGSINFSEPIKADGSYLVTRPVNGPIQQLQTKLYVVDNAGNENLYDGVRAEFDRDYSNAVDMEDALKLVNFGENLGMISSGKNLSVERRAPLNETDTIFYNLAQVRVQQYRFEFIAENLDAGLTGFLEDSYLNSKTVVSMSGTTRVDFSVSNDAGSYAPDRFRLVFKQTTPVPVTFTSVRANRKDEDILVEWKVENQLNIHHYEVERSPDARSFSKMNEQLSTGSGAVQYSWLDANPYLGDNFYRIRSVGINGDMKISQVVKVNMAKAIPAITVFPNPVRENGMVYVSLENQPSGNYQVSVVNNEGQTILQKTLNHAGGSSVYGLKLEKFVAHGHYLLVVTGDNNVKLTYKIVY